MSCKLVETRPKKDLLNPNFVGYKLSLDSIPTVQKTLEHSVLRTLPKSSQYSFLHVKLLGLHNHLYGESTIDGDCLYFIDNLWKVNKLNADPVYNESNEIAVVFEIPNPIESQEASLNPSLLLLSHYGIVLLTDGFGSFYILDTNEDTWKVLFSDRLVEVGVQFSIKDATCCVNTENNLRSIECVFLGIRMKDETNFSVLHLLTFAENDKNTWDQTTFKEMTSKGAIYYSFLDREAKNAIIVASDNSVQFTLDSENPIQAKVENVPEKVYSWSQNEEKITLTFACNISNSDINVELKEDSIVVKFKDNIKLEGKLHGLLEVSDSSYSLDNDVLTVILSKSDGGMMWPEVVIGDKGGECQVSADDAEEVHRKLGHLCTENEVGQDSGTLFNSQQTEDCDILDPDRSAILERLDAGPSHSCTHRLHLNANGILLTVNSDGNTAIPAIALRHDVDACVWKLGFGGGGSGGAEGLGEWGATHQATLYAFGYVQASKQQRKFSCAPPDLSYVAILDSTRHIFIYRQWRPIDSGCHLRHRGSGRQVPALAQQQVVTLDTPTHEILGVYATNGNMYVLTECHLYVLSIV